MDTGPHRIEMEEWLDCAPFERLLRMSIEKAEAGSAVLTMPFVRDLAQGAGLMHGGALVSLADTAVVMAIKSFLPENTHFATISLESRFLYPVTRGTVTARATVTEAEGRLFHGVAHLYDEEGREVMRFASLFKVARKQFPHKE